MTGQRDGLLDYYGCTHVTNFLLYLSVQYLIHVYDDDTQMLRWVSLFLHYSFPSFVFEDEGGGTNIQYDTSIAYIHVYQRLPIRFRAFRYDGVGTR
jgi:hypothetical protein